ncbi:Zinc metalloprotease [Corynebacterium humireducens NBRC 106098 = DSM 45392]|uniref:Zinc metalloprotease n=2 Tax=Corynebacterium humireducens TaxID=1223514 RepID=A0A0B5D503_9CORY|nr:Zinc metalloprotease [Corynebacterium humireducens NBRC 106098 = DSM 45392]
MEDMTEEQGGADRSQVMLVVLIVLAFIASVVMLFTDSDGALKLALLASLWAAIIGFFLVFRYRREAESARRELTHHGELHDVEVARAAAEREALAESRALELRDKQHSRDTEVLQEIQRELAGIRAQLETLAGREFEYEPAALRAEARRIMELENMTFEHAQAEEPELPLNLPRLGAFSGAPSADAVAGRLGQQPTRPQANPLTEIIRERQAAEAAQKKAEKAEKAEAPVKPAKEDKKAEKKAAREDLAETRVFDTGSFQAVSWDEGGDRHVREEPAEAVVEKETEAAEPRRGRRRRDEQSGALSVAELLARARARENQES